MFLKRLTMKGFKSFADATTLEFEQGVTAVVGPNGSGKSNVVDAVAWVLGAQSARALRSGKMEDVIFAGTANRPALGRAEVTLTLDNADGRLPIDGAEVTISRTLFRNGDSEYAINGTTCRLLDIQELLSDSGVGRQQHMIIGQGQLDSVLNSRSEDRRAVIEEAAGVLKHRRRKERAERRLGQTQENLERLGDLVREVRRQMRPLERQAAAARNFADVDSELRNVRRALYSDRLRVFETRRGELDSVLRTSDGLGRELRNELVRLDAQASAAAAEVASRREEHLASTLGQLQGLAERVRGTLGLINERRRSVRATLEASADENVVANLEADAAKLAADLLDLTMVETELAPQRVEIETARTSLGEAEAQFEATWGDAIAGQSEASLARVQEQAEIVQRSVDTGRQGLERVNARRSGATSRAEEVRAARETAVNARGEAERAVTEATVAHGRATVQEREAEERIRAVESELRELTDTAARTQARAEALARALEEFSGGGGRSLIGELDGVLGAFLDLVEVEPGWEKAVESAAGASLGAVVVDGRTSAHAALSALRRDGGAGLILPAVAATGERPSAPAGCESLRSRVSVRPGTPDDVVRVLDALFARAFVARDWESGIDIALSNPDLIVVTADGDRFAATGWRVASGRAVVTRSSVEEAHAVARVAADHVEPATEAALKARTANNEARTAVRESLNTLTKAEATLDRWTKEGVRLEAELTTVEALVTSSTTEATEATEALGELEFELSTLLQQLPALELAVSESSQRAAWADEARVTLEAHRAQVATLVSEVGKREAELGERRRLIESRQSDVERRLAGHAAERAEATERRQSLEFELQSLDRLEVIVRQAGDDVHLNQEALESTYREQLEASRAGAEQLEALRRERTVTEARLTELGDTGRKAEIEHAELAIKVTTLHDSIRREIEIEPEDLGLVAAPELPEGVTLEHRLVELETRINALGPINPLALEELTALESRYQELDGQVADVRHARRELQEVVRALDEEIMTTFSSAMADVNEHFSSLIAMLFPGGQGRLMLTDPEDLLNTGVEIEVRPMGRNVRRVSLLSGGERSLAALAFLFAVFRSRPSPFYMMDEVEAALDDVNLQRFLSLVADFRDEAQLLMVTHQKRTMESADALYGVTMVPGASSKVVSQRVKRTKES